MNLTKNWNLTCSTNGETRIVHIETVDPGLVRYVTQYDPADHVGRSYDWEKGRRGRYTAGFGEFLVGEKKK